VRPGAREESKENIQDRLYKRAAPARSNSRDLAPKSVYSKKAPVYGQNKFQSQSNVNLQNKNLGPRKASVGAYGKPISAMIGAAGETKDADIDSKLSRLQDLLKMAKN